MASEPGCQYLCKGQTQVGEQYPTRGFLSATSDVLHFGLGTIDLIDSLIVRWPDRSTEVIKSVPADRVLTLEMKNALRLIGNDKTNKEKVTLFTEAQIPGLEFIHKEDKYVDFQRELLIPHSFPQRVRPLLLLILMATDWMICLLVVPKDRLQKYLFSKKMKGSKNYEFRIPAGK